ncbi:MULTISPECIES: VOC family protein [Paenibacillus]|uniref:Extradiol dioxygenase n=1 Tax=Paenibacillus campinasensis TaxID=66347 RepID=A0A268F0Q3_9BACL|nr:MULTISPECIES: VOC family protein [Paenibacillus]MUG65650.1 extradiol dioxygenase [Paenibacillus campinasensis]PAD78957.1 extradiol dioxygenase [Paenibacillus campinasensis]PAK54297.1 extradiol dioxygenase [Paenibacillus sp. 7541]
MPNEFWVNLPVENLDRSRQFYKEIGFTFHPEYVDRDDTAALLLGDNQVLVMLLPEAAFSTFTGHAPAEVSGTGVEALLSIDVGSRERVHEVIGQAVKAGGTIFSEPQAQGWMYGAGFADPDGHRWNVLCTDVNQVPQE